MKMSSKFLPYRFLDSLTLEYGTESVSKRRQTTIKILYVTAQKSEDLIYTAAEAWNFEFSTFSWLHVVCLHVTVYA